MLQSFSLLLTTLLFLATSCKLPIPKNASIKETVTITADETLNYDLSIGVFAKSANEPAAGVGFIYAETETAYLGITTYMIWHDLCRDNTKPCVIRFKQNQIIAKPEQDDSLNEPGVVAFSIRKSPEFALKTVAVAKKFDLDTFANALFVVLGPDAANNQRWKGVTSTGAFTASPEIPIQISEAPPLPGSPVFVMHGQQRVAVGLLTRTSILTDKSPGTDKGEATSPSTFARFNGKVARSPNFKPSRKWTSSQLVSLSEEKVVRVYPKKAQLTITEIQDHLWRYDFTLPKDLSIATLSLPEGASIQELSPGTRVLSYFLKFKDSNITPVIDTYGDVGKKGKPITYVVIGFEVGL